MAKLLRAISRQALRCAIDACISVGPVFGMMYPGPIRRGSDGSLVCYDSYEAAARAEADYRRRGCPGPDGPAGVPCEELRGDCPGHPEPPTPLSRAERRRWAALVRRLGDSGPHDTGRQV